MNARPEPFAKLSCDNVLHIIVCLGLFVVFVAFALRPAVVEYGEQRERLARAKTQDAEESVLLPFQLELTSELNPTPDEALKPIDPVPLRKEDIAFIHERLLDISKAHGLSLQNVAPRVHSTQSGLHYLGVLLRADGAFTDMRPFLLDLMRMPCFYHLERFKISEGLEQENLEVQIWLSVL